MEAMFCHQCEQTAKGSGCTASGVCGKTSDAAREQDMLICELIGLAKLVRDKGKEKCGPAADFMVEGLFATLTNVSFDQAKIAALDKKCKGDADCWWADWEEVKLGFRRITREKLKVMKPEELFRGDRDMVSLRSTLLFGLKGMAAYAHHARALGRRDPEVDAWFVKGLAALGEEHTADEWLGLLMEFGGVNLKCLALLDAANTGAYGDPVPTRVPLKVEKGPFIVVSGHDLLDLKMLLEQTEGRGVNVYTHCEMLPAHAYPGLKKHPQLKGHYGTAWQNQQKEFESLPAPIFFTTNCLMPPKAGYADRVFVTPPVSFPGAVSIEADAEGRKDFGPLIERAIKLGGFSEDRQFAGPSGGTELTTGFGRKAILDNAPAIIEAVKGGAIKHFFLVGGCDGLKSGRKYYTDFVKKTPRDTVVLTLACGKFRFNDQDAGAIGPFPRILDVGQCNDAYGAVQVALALAGAFNCGVNDLPLTLVLSWYEQKAVCILLTLLSLGLKNIYIGPSVPAFFSETVLGIIVDKFGLRPIGAPEEDLARILKAS